MASGLLSVEEFKECIERFVETSTRLGDGWHTVPVDPPSGASVYMRKKSAKCAVTESARHDYKQKEQAAECKSGSAMSCRLPSEESQFNSLTDGFLLLNEEETLEEDDVNCVVMSTLHSQPLTYDYHIIYSQSYAVPVLYVNVSTSSGQRLTLDEVWALCPDSFQPYLNDNKWTTLTQQEHPLLGCPFLMLHPCHTADLMKQVFKSVQDKGNVNYLVTWLSTVGPMVGLEISSEYAAH